MSNILTVCFTNSQLLIIKDLQKWIFEVKNKKQYSFLEWHVQEERYYLRRTLNQWQEYCPGHTPSGYAKAIGFLKRQGIITIRKLNAYDKDQTNYYTLNPDRLQAYMREKLVDLLDRFSFVKLIKQNLCFQQLKKIDSKLKGIFQDGFLGWLEEAGIQAMSYFVQGKKNLVTWLIRDQEVKNKIHGLIDDYESVHYPRKVSNAFKNLVAYPRRFKKTITKKTQINQSTTPAKISINEDNSEIISLTVQLEQPTRVDNSESMKIDQPENLAITPRSIKTDKYFGSQQRNPQKQGVLGKIPEGPWINNNRLDQNFLEYIAKQWMSQPKSQFAGQTLIQVKRAVLGSYVNEGDRIALDWQMYHEAYHQRIANLYERKQSNMGIKSAEISELYQHQRAIYPAPAELTGMDEDITIEQIQDSLLLLEQLYTQQLNQVNEQSKTSSKLIPETVTHLVPNLTMTDREAGLPAHFLQKVNQRRSQEEK